jgi:hypothetical protein
MIKFLDDNNGDGVILGQNASAKVGLYGGPAIPQRSVPMQASIQGLGGAQLVTLQFSLTPTAVTGNAILETTVAITPTLGSFCATSDFVLAVSKPTLSAGLGVAGVRISAANQIAINFANPTGAPVTPGQEIYTAVVAQGFPVVTQTITPLAVASMSSLEQIFTIQGSGAIGTAVINGSGQVVGVQITAGGSGYFYPPAVTFAGGPPLGSINSAIVGSGPGAAGIIGGSPFSSAIVGSGNVSGTAVGLDSPAATSQYPYGSGATGIGVVSGGAVVGVVMTAFGSGYQASPAVTFVGGNTFSPGMIAHVNKPSATAGLGIGNVRVVGPYQIGVEYINDTVSTITPPTEVYRFLVTNELPAVNNILQYVWTAATPIMGLLGALTGTTLEMPVTISGILANDLIAGGASKPSAQTGISPGSVRIAAASLIQVQLIGTGCATITAGEYWNIPVWRQQPAAPSNLLYPYLSFTSQAAASTTTEISVSVVGVPANSMVYVNKPSMTSGLALTNSRVTGLNSVALQFHNTTSAAITIPSEVYTVECFNTPVPAAGVNALSYHIQAINPTFNAIVDLGNELRDSLDVFNQIKGD